MKFLIPFFAAALLVPGEGAARDTRSSTAVTASGVTKNMTMKEQKNLLVNEWSKKDYHKAPTVREVLENMDHYTKGNPAFNSAIRALAKLSKDFLGDMHPIMETLGRVVVDHNRFTAHRIGFQFRGGSAFIRAAFGAEGDTSKVVSAATKDRRKGLFGKEKTIGGRPIKLDRDWYGNDLKNMQTIYFSIALPTDGSAIKATDKIEINFTRKGPCDYFGSNFD